MASFTVSLSRNRWYFHYEGSGQFGGTSETLGYADAAFNSCGAGSLQFVWDAIPSPQFDQRPFLRREPGEQYAKELAGRGAAKNDIAAITMQVSA